MDGREFFESVALLERSRAIFATATVVARRAPVSAHVGDRAIVYADGRMDGFVGGSCARDVVRRQAVSAMRAGSARLVQIRPGASADADDQSPSGTILVPMSCTSEGAVDVYVEPYLPPRTLLVAGETPVADALASIGALLDNYRIIRVRKDSDLHDIVTQLGAGDRAGLIAVVATQGHYDESVLEALLEADPPAYVGLLASRKRAAGIFATLEARGVARERLATVRNPAGLDIGARRPGDVAISILAEIVASLTANETPPVPVEDVADSPADHTCCHA